jgi:4-alpha-glucanotransferase
MKGGSLLHYMHHCAVHVDQDVISQAVLCTVLLLLQVSEYAASKRVVLKGDLPIGVDKRSVDTWMEVRGPFCFLSLGVFCTLLFCS